MINNKFFISCFFLFIIILFFFIYQFDNHNRFFIKKNLESFYFIPKDKKGIKVKDLDKKILHVLDDEKLEINFDNDIYLKYSFQLFTSNNFNEISSQLDFYATNHNIPKKDLYIASLSTKIEREFFLLYLNFENRESALNNCPKLLKYKNKCIIVNVENMN